MLPVESGQSETHLDFEHYDAEKAISLVIDIGKLLAADTDSRVHRFRMAWVNGLVERYRKNPGNPVVHLDDLLESTMVWIDTNAASRLAMPRKRFGGLPLSAKDWDRYRGVMDVARGHPSRFVRLRTLKQFCRLTGLKVNELEPFVTRLRISGGRSMRMLERPKLPFDLATESGARVIGFQSDANSRNASFTNSNPNLHEDYKRRVKETFGDLTITTTSSSEGGFGKGSYLRTNVGKLVTSVLSVGGLDLSIDQKLANNPIPLWMNLCPLPVIASFIGALWDAEGSVNVHDLKLSQAVPFKEENLDLPYWPANTPFGHLDVVAQETIESCPPLLLVSAAILLRRIGVVSRLQPTKACMTSTGPTSYWQLRVEDVLSILRFRENIGLVSAAKRQALAESA